MLLIADETKAVALAGVMGGQNSEINPATADVLIESACFKPQNIRATSKKLELRTESSYRYERGADIGICDWASQRAAQLILDTAGGTLAQGVVDAYPKAFEPKQIALRHTQTDAVLGISVPMEEQIEYLQRLGLEIATAARRRWPLHGHSDATHHHFPRAFVPSGPEAGAALQATKVKSCLLKFYMEGTEPTCTTYGARCAAARPGRRTY